MEFSRILLPVVRSEASDEAVRLACRLARKDKGKIWAVYVITIRRSLPLNAAIEPEIKEGEEILDHAQSVAEEDDYQIETDLLQAREAGPAVVDAAVEREADLILMGVKHERRFGQFSLGSVAPYVLENAPCRVLLYQHYTT